VFNFFEAFKLIMSFLIGVKSFLLRQKKSEIILIKDKALESRDQRELELVLSENDLNRSVPLDAGNYTGLYERAIKKKP
jgi:hypothetical protein